MKVDLHVHTTASDGELSPKELIHQCLEEGIEVISITDHDTVKGLLDIEKEEIKGIKVISGIEVSSREICPIHILGYHIDIHNQEFLEFLDRIEIFRMKEIKQVVRILSIEVDSEINCRRIIKEQGCLTINSIADYLCTNGFSASRQDSYDKYLGENKCAFVQKKCPEPKEVIESITRAGGIPVLAHPNRLHMELAEQKAMIKRLGYYGLKGIEIYCKNMKELAFYNELCKEHQLIITGGSDFHKRNDRLGYWCEEELIPASVCDELLG